jgi:hypothetical protein
VFFKTFTGSLIVTVIALAVGFVYGGLEALILVGVLGILEISLSFDNAVVNARILERMSAFWQKMFLTVGILVAVLGMRILFPLLIVAVTAQLNPVEAVRLALEQGSIDEPGTYAYILNDAHPQIAAFGGIFLLMLFLDFMFDDRDIRWLRIPELAFAWVGKLGSASVVIGLAALVVASLAAGEKQAVVLVAGACGMIAYFLVTGLGSLFEVDDENDDDDVDPDEVAARAEKIAGAPRNTGGNVVGRAAFLLFLYLEVIDASFSFDGVIGAFAITSDPILIALGLGLIGAIFVRSLTVFLVRAGTLDDYVYLDHGAHWAIGALATILLISISVHVEEVVTGLIGVVFILAAFVSSLVRNKRLAASTDSADATPADVVG